MGWWALIAPIVSAFGVEAARRYALRRRLLDEPGERRSHHVATPRGGGIGPAIAVAMAIAAFGLSGTLTDVRWPWAIAGLAAVAGVGAWDDHRPLSASFRLAVHLVAGAMLAIAFQADESPLMFAATVAVVAVLVNVWNFMDGIDGIASLNVVAVLAACLLVMPSADPGRWLIIAAIGAVAAFVPFNFPRARIFLGDVGSGTLGYLLAFAALMLWSSGSRMGVLLPLFPAAPFLLDSALTLAMRMSEGERWWTPHTRHLYQVAARRFGHVRTTLPYSAAAFAGVLLAGSVMDRGEAVIIVSLAVWYTAGAVAWWMLQRRWAPGSATH